MPVYARKTVRLGIVRLNLTRGGFSSWSMRIWPWSWNSKTRRHTVDLPGPWSWRSKPRPATKTAATSATGINESAKGSEPR